MSSLNRLAIAAVTSRRFRNRLQSEKLIAGNLLI